VSAAAVYWHDFTLSHLVTLHGVVLREVCLSPERSFHEYANHHTNVTHSSTSRGSFPDIVEIVFSLRECSVQPSSGEQQTKRVARPVPVPILLRAVNLATSFNTNAVFSSKVLSSHGSEHHKWVGLIPSHFGTESPTLEPVVVVAPLPLERVIASWCAVGQPPSAGHGLDPHVRLFRGSTLI